MQTQVRPPRQRSSGGRTLMLLGLVLALAAAAIVFYVANGATTSSTDLTTVVVAKIDLHAGTILTLNNSVAPSVRIQDAFALKQIDKKLLPDNAYTFVNQDKLNTDLNNKIVREDFLSGDVLRTTDPRLADIGTTSGTSLVNINPPSLAKGQVLFIMTVDNGAFGVQPGDMIDILATITFVDVNNHQDTLTQTTLTNVLVYAVDTPAKGKVIVVLKNQDAVYLTELEHGASLTLVIRKPGDDTDPGTQSVDPTSIFNHFKFGNPAQS